MPTTSANGTNLFYELRGAGDPLVLVHGSWADAFDWALVVDALAESFQVLAYDRRGHSRSERPETQGSVDEDGDDLAALIEALDLAPAHVVTSSYGGNVALRLAARQPELFRSLTCHEPPLVGLLLDDPESAEIMAQVGRSLESVAAKIAAGDHEGAARQFIDEVALGPGAWEGQLPPEAKAIVVNNAPTFLDELNDPEQTRIDPSALARVEAPVRLTQGSESPPMFARVIDRLVPLLPRATRETITGAGHVPQLETPERYVEVVTRTLAQPAG